MHAKASPPSPWSAERNVRNVLLSAMSLFGRSKKEALSGAWMDDGAAKDCLICGVKFTFTTRRHHCRVRARGMSAVPLIMSIISVVYNMYHFYYVCHVSHFCHVAGAAWQLSSHFRARLSCHSRLSCVTRAAVVSLVRCGAEVRQGGVLQVLEAPRAPRELSVGLREAHLPGAALRVWRVLAVAGAYTCAVARAQECAEGIAARAAAGDHSLASADAGHGRCGGGHASARLRGMGL